jgi:hypothetical protein
MSKAASAMLALFLFLGIAYGIALNGSEPIQCQPDLGLNTPLQGNAAAVEQILTFCKSSARCKELFGQSNGDKLDLFEAILQKTTEFEPPLFLETPINAYVCSSQASLVELNALLWVLRIERDYLDSDLMCGLDEDPHLLDPNTFEVTCRPCPGCDIQAENDTYLLFYVFGGILLLVIVIFVGVMIWRISLEERKYQLRMRGFNERMGVNT